MGTQLPLGSCIHLGRHSRRPPRGSGRPAAGTPCGQRLHVLINQASRMRRWARSGLHVSPSRPKLYPPVFISSSPAAFSCFCCDCLRCPERPAGRQELTHRHRQKHCAHQTLLPCPHHPALPFHGSDSAVASDGAGPGLLLSAFVSGFPSSSASIKILFRSSAVCVGPAVSICLSVDSAVSVVGPL